MKETGQITGKETFIRQGTGEICELQAMETREPETDANFHKIFLHDFIRVLEQIASQKTMVFCWILEHLTGDNRLLYTYRQIADSMGCSYATAANAMRMLQKEDILHRLADGYYMVNPDVIFKGSYQKRCMARRRFEKELYTKRDGD